MCMSPTMGTAVGPSGQALNNRLSDFCWFGVLQMVVLAAAVAVTDCTSWQVADDPEPPEQCCDH